MPAIAPRCRHAISAIPLLPFFIHAARLCIIIFALRLFHRADIMPPYYLSPQRRQSYALLLILATLMTPH